MSSKFTIPSLVEIKAANKISSKNEPSLFKASTGKVSTQPQVTASSSGAVAQSTSASMSLSCNEGSRHSAPTSAAPVRNPEKTGKKVPSTSMGNS